MDPDFINVDNSLEVKDTIGISTPLISGINTDITGRSRLSPTTMGAYELFPTKRDLMLLQFASWNNDVVKNQTVQVNVDARNLGILVTTATFGWSLNGVEQPSVSWTANPVFGLLEQRTIPIASFVASGVDTIKVVVWVKTVNGEADTVQWNDTVSAWAQIVPLAEFVEPFIEDTISSLLFNVNVRIRESSGATLTTPQMYIETVPDRSGSCYVNTYDTVTMEKAGDNWVAGIPRQYYGSTVMYETHISYSIGNNVILKDTVRIEYRGVVKIDRVTYLFYTGAEQSLFLPIGTYKIECCGAQGVSSNGGDLSSSLSKIGGKGGYSVGEITLSSSTTAYIYVGGEGLPQGILASGCFNGGGNSAAGATIACGSGGGASDVRIGSNSLYSRVIVAGGGGAAGFQECSVYMVVLFCDLL